MKLCGLFINCGFLKIYLPKKILKNVYCIKLPNYGVSSKIPLGRNDRYVARGCNCWGVRYCIQSNRISHWAYRLLSLRLYCLRFEIMAQKMMSRSFVKRLANLSLFLSLLVSLKLEHYTRECKFRNFGVIKKKHSQKKNNTIKQKPLAEFLFK